MSRVNKLALTLGALVVVSIFLLLIGNEKKSFSTLDKSMFMVQDTTAVQSLTIAYGDKIIEVRRGEVDWQLIGQNGKNYKADPSLIHLMQMITSRVEVQRAVSTLNLAAIKEDLQQGGKRITITDVDGESLIYYSGGNANKTTAYFGNADLSEIYVVAIPGYKSYVSGLFELTLNQWRDRVLFSSSWQSLQKLSIVYTADESPSLDIAFADRFLRVEGVLDLDTTALMNYLKPLEFFQINDYLAAGDFPQYDSLMKQKPLATVKVVDVDYSKNKELTIFPLIDGAKFYLLTDASREMIVVDQERIEKLLVSSTFFVSK